MHGTLKFGGGNVGPDALVVPDTDDTDAEPRRVDAAPGRARASLEARDAWTRAVRRSPRLTAAAARRHRLFLWEERDMMRLLALWLLVVGARGFGAPGASPAR